MTKCSNCGDEVIIGECTTNTRKIAIEWKPGVIVCIGCHEALEFCEEINTPKRKPKIIPVKRVVTSNYICTNKTCNASYTGPICPECQTPNILTKRHIKKRRKRKRKKKK